MIKNWRKCKELKGLPLSSSGRMKEDLGHFELPEYAYEITIPINHELRCNLKGVELPILNLTDYLINIFLLIN